MKKIFKLAFAFALGISLCTTNTYGMRFLKAGIAFLKAHPINCRRAPNNFYVTNSPKQLETIKEEIENIEIINYKQNDLNILYNLKNIDLNDKSLNLFGFINNDNQNNTNLDKDDKTFLDDILNNLSEEQIENFKFIDKIEFMFSNNKWLETNHFKKFCWLITEKLYSFTDQSNQSNLSIKDLIEPNHIPLHDWVLRILSIAKITPCAPLIALVYLNRIKTQFPKLKINENNIRRLFLSACIIADKCYADATVKNSDWLIVANNNQINNPPIYSLQLINKIERELIELLGWKLNVEFKELNDMLKQWSRWTEFKESVI